MMMFFFLSLLAHFRPWAALGELQNVGIMLVSTSRDRGQRKKGSTEESIEINVREDE